MQTVQGATVSLPIPSRWGISADIAGRPIVWGDLIINSFSDNQIVGTIRFRDVPIPIQGAWDESGGQITFDSPYATYSGQLSLYDDPSIGIRHFILNGRLTRKPPSLQAGESGTWLATTDISLSAFPSEGKTKPSKPSGLPPVGVFVTTNLLYGVPSRF